MPHHTHDTLPPLSTQLQALIEQGWEQEVLSQLPATAAQQARTMGALRRARGLSCQDLAQKGPCLTLVQDDREVTVGEQWAKAAAHVLSPGICASQADALYSLVG